MVNVCCCYVIKNYAQNIRCVSNPFHLLQVYLNHDEYNNVLFIKQCVKTKPLSLWRGDFFQLAVSWHLLEMSHCYNRGENTT